MRRRFPTKKKGDSLSHNHVNGLSQSASKFERMVPGSFANARHTGSNISIPGAIPNHIRGATISSLTIDDDDTETSGLYYINLRYYSFQEDGWKDDSKNWILDTTVEGDNVYFDVGEKLRVYWHEQRGVFVPFCMPELFWCRLEEDHPGRGVPFDIQIGTWSASAHEHTFDEDPTVKEVGIDWHSGVPLPDKYAQGWFRRERPSEGGDYVYICVSLDCVSSGYSPPGDALDCYYCIDGTSPYQLAVTIPTMANRSCDDCGAFAGTYVVTQLYECWWEEYFDDPSSCGDGLIRVLVVWQAGPSQSYLFVQLDSFTSDYSFVANLSEWMNTYAPIRPIDCNFDNYHVSERIVIITNCDPDGNDAILNVVTNFEGTGTVS